MLPQPQRIVALRGFEAKRESTGDAELVVVRGDVDLASAPTLSSALNDAVWQGQGPVIVDLARVEFMDSTGLHLLLNALRRLTRNGRSLELVCPGEGALRTIRSARLDGTFRLHPTREAALGAAAIAS